MQVPMHTIRLRGPWQVEPVSRFVLQPDASHVQVTEDLPPPARQTMPADWSESLGVDFLGCVRYRRTFQKPTGLETGERVWLVIEPPRSRGVVSVNDDLLGVVLCGGAPARFDITELLAVHNRLEIVVDHPPLDEAGVANDDSTSQMPGGLVGEVRLEIEEND